MTLTLPLYGEITALEELRLSLQGPHLRLSPGLTDLSYISSLSLSAHHAADDTENKIMLSDFDWQGFPGLQELHLDCVTFTCDHRLLGLTSLTELRTLSFEFDSLGGFFTIRCFAALMYKLNLCPDLQVNVNYNDISQ